MARDIDMDMERETPKTPSMPQTLRGRVVKHAELAPNEKEKEPEKLEPNAGPNRSLAGILSLVPPEIIEQIAFFLSTAENNAFRRTCKYIEHCTFAHWEKTCLASIQTDLSLRSFQRLSDLIMEEPLAARVKKIVITERNYGGLGAGFKWERIEGIRYLETNQDSIKMWQVLFQQFDNLRTVRVQRPVTAWDLDELELLTASDAFTVVMHIIITAQLPITAFELDFEAQGWNAIDLCRVRSTQLTGKSFENSWNRLRALSMRLKVADRPVSNLPYYLMRSCPNLKSLSLDCDGGEDAGTVLKYMAENWMNPLWKLEEIALRKITVLDVPHFRGFLLRHRSTLRKLKLASINLDEPFIWPKVFAMLRTNFPKLESIEVGDLRDFGDARRLVHFPNVSTTSTADTGGVRFVYHQRKWPAVDPRATKKNFYIAYQGDDIKTALWLLEQWVVYLPLGP